ncbi:MAG: GrpB family protein [Micrococcaceae bacterium]
MHSNDVRLEKVIVGKVVPHNNQITLKEYDSNWPRLFECEAKRIKSILGKQAIEIEHVGSTSVPGLTAKPIIDILLVVPNSADEDAYVPLLEKAGYILKIREPDWFEHRLFKGPDTDINMHVFTEGENEIKQMLDFRNQLRTHPEDRKKYETVKRNLAQKKWRHVQDYADAKTEVIQEIKKKISLED